MKVAIMQPYLFPYIGYFQLIQAVDAFVVYDDVNFIKGGWINRNYILGNTQKQLITLQLVGASPNKLINEISIGNNQKKILKTIRQTYSKAPQFSRAFPVIEDILMQKEESLSRFIEYSLHELCNYLDIDTEFHISSALEKDNNLRGQDKVIEICNVLEASTYINSPGGAELYNRAAFLEQGIMLSFIQPRVATYKQYSHTFLPNLSIVDVIMFNNNDECAALLQEYELV